MKFLPDDVDARRAILTSISDDNLNRYVSLLELVSENEAAAMCAQAEMDDSVPLVEIQEAACRDRTVLLEELKSRTPDLHAA